MPCRSIGPPDVARHLAERGQRRLLRLGADQIVGRRPARLVIAAILSGGSRVAL